MARDEGLSSEWVNINHSKIYRITSNVQALSNMMSKSIPNTIFFQMFNQYHIFYCFFVEWLGSLSMFPKLDQI